MYARMCVEIDLNAPLLPSYTVDGNKLRIEYEGLQQICFSCGKFGHHSDHCPSKVLVPSSAKPQPDLPTSGTSPTETTEEVYGRWMVAQDPRKGKRGMGRAGKGDGARGKEADAGTGSTKSRFAVLEVEEDRSSDVRSGPGERQPLQEISNRPVTFGDTRKNLGKVEGGPVQVRAGGAEKRKGQKNGKRSEESEGATKQSQKERRRGKKVIGDQNVQPQAEGEQSGVNQSGPSVEAGTLTMHTGATQGHNMGQESESNGSKPMTVCGPQEDQCEDHQVDDVMDLEKDLGDPKIGCASEPIGPAPSVEDNPMGPNPR